MRNCFIEFLSSLDVDFSHSIAANYEHKENVTHNNDKWQSRRLAAVKRSPIKRLRRDGYNNRASNGLRAASVFSNRSSVKRRRPDRIRKRRPKVNNNVNNKPPTPVIQIDDEDDQGDESNDDELLELRLMALKTKLERIDNDQHQVETREEEELRIQALKSAVFKNRDEIREKMRKKKQKDEQRPYSPSDQPFLDDEDMVLSPVESPQVDCHDEIDMDISNSNSPAEELKELSDMDIVESPQSLGSDENSREVDEDEIALRAQLLTSMAKKKQEETVQAKKKEAEKKQLTENLKLAVQRIKQQKRPKETEPTPSEHLLASALERIRSKLVQSNNMDQKKLEEVMRIENTKLQTNVEVFQPIEPIVEESVELDKSKEAATALMATITDTKNIPLINEGRSTKKSRLITSLDAVMRPVAKLIITVNNDSDTDDYDECRFSRRTVKRTVRRTVSGCEKRELKNVEFESRLDNFLRNIRQQQEELSVNVPSSASSATNSASSAVKHLPPSSQKEYEKLIAKMKFLEAEKRKRMRARQLKRTKSNSQTISTSTEPTASALTAPTPTTVAKRSPDKPKMCQTATVIKPQATPTKTSDDKISNTLMKISLLDQEAQQRLMIKTESNFRTHRWVDAIIFTSHMPAFRHHLITKTFSFVPLILLFSESLCQAASESVKILEANAADMKRQERITTEIAELEKQLKRYKSSLNVLNKRIRGSVGKFIQSQRELLQSRTRQKGFEQRICIPFGKMLKGPDYK